MVDEHRVRGIYNKPLAKAIGQKIPLTAKQLNLAGKIILECIKVEIKKDIAKASGMGGRGKPVPLPQTTGFADSFSVKVTGTTIEITSTWPTAKAHTTEVRKKNFLNNTRPDATVPFEMTWLMRPKVPFARIVRQDGTVIVRTTPDASKGDKPWIHPGFLRYTFLERGIRKGREEAVRALAEEIVKELLSTHDLFG